MKKKMKNKKKNNALLLTTEVVNQSSHQRMNKKYIDVLEEELKLMKKITNENKDQLKKYKNFNLSLNEQVTKLNDQVSKLKKHNKQIVTSGCRNKVRNTASATRTSRCPAPVCNARRAGTRRLRHLQPTPQRRRRRRRV